MKMILLHFVIGAFSWSLFEYFLHRFVGHSKKKLGMFSQEHRTHHRVKDYFAPAKAKVIFAIIIFSVFFALGAGAFGAGWVLGYSFYEWLHWDLHVSAPRSAYGLWARKHHFAHHFQHPKSNYGVSTSFWDHVFRTYEKVDTVQVPKSYELRWIKNEGMHSSIFSVV